MRRTLFGNSGAALVEFAIVGLLLLTLIFGIIEFGLLFHDFMALEQVASVGARTAALGAPVETINAYIQNAAPPLDVTKLTATLQYRVYTTSWSAWATMANGANNQNNAPSGSQVRVTLSYVHTLVTPTLFSSTFGGSTTKTVNASMVERRQ